MNISPLLRGCPHSSRICPGWRWRALKARYFPNSNILHLASKYPALIADHAVTFFSLQGTLGNHPHKDLSVTFDLPPVTTESRKLSCYTYCVKFTQMSTWPWWQKTLCFCFPRFLQSHLPLAAHLQSWLGWHTWAPKWPNDNCVRLLALFTYSGSLQEIITQKPLSRLLV